MVFNIYARGVGERCATALISITVFHAYIRPAATEHTEMLQNHVATCC